MRNRLTTVNDASLRSAAARRGCVLVKRRDKMNTAGIGTGYMILDQFTGDILAGQKFEMSPEDVRDFLNQH